MLSLLCLSIITLAPVPPGYTAYSSATAMGYGAAGPTGTIASLHPFTEDAWGTDMDQWQRNIEPNDIVSFANPEVTILYTIRSGAVDAITKTFDSVTGKTNWQFHITANEISPSTTLVFVDDFNAKDTGGPVLLNDGTSPLTQTAVTEAGAYPGGG